MKATTTVSTLCLLPPSATASSRPSALVSTDIGATRVSIRRLL